MWFSRSLATIFLCVYSYSVYVDTRPALAPSPISAPRLIGWDCEGASEEGPLYADNEDDFPRCDDIHLNDGRDTVVAVDTIPNPFVNEE